MKGLDKPEAAASWLGMTILVLRDFYTDEEIKFILKRKNIESAMKILDEKPNNNLQP